MLCKHAYFCYADTLFLFFAKIMQCYVVQLRPQYLSTGLHYVLLMWVFLLCRVACRVVCSKEEEEEEEVSAVATRPTATRTTWTRRVHTSPTKLLLL